MRLVISECPTSLRGVWPSGCWNRPPRHAKLSIEEWYEQETHYHLYDTAKEERRRYLPSLQCASALIFTVSALLPVYLFTPYQAFVSSQPLYPTLSDLNVTALFSLFVYAAALSG